MQALSSPGSDAKELLYQAIDFEATSGGNLHPEV